MAFQNNQNFNHPHVLHHLKLDEQKQISCNACEETITTTTPFHGCPPCNFHLHTQCFNTPLHLHHPSHPSHPLTLVPTSPRSYNCDACGFHGNGLSSYNCSSCDFDIHLRCANLPMSLHVNEHHHDLRLFLTSPYNDSNIRFQCDFCHGMKENHLWSYYCQECDFGTHVGCAMKFKETTNNNYGTHSSSTMSEIERIKAISRDQEELDAAILEAKIAAKGRRAALDLWGGGRRRRKGSYYSDSSDDDYY